MNRSVIIVLAALMVSAAVPAVAQQSHQDQAICELAARNCKYQLDNLQQRIKKLNAEIKKGTKAYSAEELKKLEQKLKEAQAILDNLEGKAPGK